MMATSRARCPTCKAPVATDPEERPKEYPFCSDRCRLVDLHAWFSGSYAIPVANPTSEEIEALLDPQDPQNLLKRTDSE